MKTVGVMRAKYCVGFMLVGVLTAFFAVAAPANQSQSEAVTTKSQTAHTPTKPAAAAGKTPAPKRAPVASKSKSAHEVAQKRLPAAKLDLSLPPDMVRQLRPLGTIPMPQHKPLLPNMFGEKPAEESPFQLNGRLLSNEMGLQLRNEARQNEIDGAALDFEFKQ